MQHFYKAPPQSNSINKGARQRVRLLTIAVMCFLVWAGLTFWDQMGKIGVKATQLGGLTEKLTEIRELNEGYKLEVTRLNDSEYIEQKIRKNYHYTRDGETMFYP